MRKMVSVVREFSDHDMVHFFIQPQLVARTLAGGTQFNIVNSTLVDCPETYSPPLFFFLVSLVLQRYMYFGFGAEVFSLIIFASLVTEGYQNLTTSSQLYCILNDNGAACCYGITVGVLSFLQCLLFLGFDVYDTYITNHKIKYAILVLDVTFSIMWTCLWFFGFCFLANQWNRSTHSYLLGTSAARASIAFAFLSVPCWVYLAYLAVKNLWAEPPVPYKRTLDEGSVALTTLSTSTTTSLPNNMGFPENVGAASYPSTPVPHRLTLMNTDD